MSGLAVQETSCQETKNKQGSMCLFKEKLEIIASLSPGLGSARALPNQAGSDMNRAQRHERPARLIAYRAKPKS